jgi:hypothetical protein
MGTNINFVGICLMIFASVLCVFGRVVVKSKAENGIEIAGELKGKNGF